MKLLLIDDQERLVFEGNVDIKKFHIKASEPEYEDRRDFLIVPIKEQTYRLDFKADFELKNNIAFRVYPDRMKEAKLEVQSCSTLGNAKCVHECCCYNHIHDHWIECAVNGCVC